jgi:hypothetical protein
MQIPEYIGGQLAADIILTRIFPIAVFSILPTFNIDFLIFLIILKQKRPIYTLDSG